MRKWWNTAFASMAEQKAQNPSVAQPLIALQLAGEAAWTGRHYGALSRQGYQNAGQDTANIAGQRIIDRNLNVQPTLRVRQGWRFNVIVSRDLILKPYGARP